MTFAHTYQDLRAGAQYDPPLDSVAIYLYDYDRPRQELCATGVLTMTPIPENESGDRVEPTFFLRMAAAQKLMDDLWHAGIRPTQSQYTSELVAAKQEHIGHLWEIVQRIVLSPKNEA